VISQRCLFVCLFVCLFSCYLFNDAVGSAEYTAQNRGLLVNNKQIRKEVRETGGGVNWGAIPTLSTRHSGSDHETNLLLPNKEQE
jgi:hypothetical protein